MVLDSSAIVALLLKEPGFERFAEKIDQASVVAVGVPALVESAMVLTSRLGWDARLLLLGFVRNTNAELVPFSQEHFDAAMDAFLRFGKGRHPAALNFGDCMAYALAEVAGLPLLYAGGDFAKTDIRPA